MGQAKPEAVMASYASSILFRSSFDKKYYKGG
jgi:hypothetical protein